MLFFYIIMCIVEKPIHFHYLNIILLYFHFFHILNLILYTKPKSIFILILMPSNNHNFTCYTILKIRKFSIPKSLILYYNILLLKYFHPEYISQTLIYFYTRCNTSKWSYSFMPCHFLFHKNPNFFHSFNISYYSI